MDTGEKFVVSGIALFICLGLIACIFAALEENRNAKICKELGGQYLTARGMSSICIKKDSIIKLGVK